MAVGKLLQRDKPPPSEQEIDPELDKRRSLSRRVALVVEGRAADQTFGARSVTWEVQQRWGAKLRRRADPRSVVTTLRRWTLARRLHQVREGRAHYESLYSKTAPAPVRAPGASFRESPETAG